jgi:transcriptional regulator with XRE-family HTH domain
MELINKLIRLQETEGLSDEKFARKLKVHRTTWIRIKTSQVNISIEFIRKVLSKYPGLKKEVDIFLFEDAKKCSKQTQVGEC